MAQDISEPRMVYRGAADEKKNSGDPDTYENVETQIVANQDALSAALKDGWRLKRVPVKAAPVAESKDKK